MGEITLSQIVSGIAIVLAIGGFVTTVVKPITSFQKRLESVERTRDNDDKRLKALESDTKEILKSVSVMLLHMESGNGTGELRKRKAELDDFIINR